MHALVVALSCVVSLSSQHVAVNNCAYSEANWKAANRGDAVAIEKLIRDGFDVSGDCGVQLVGIAARHQFNAMLQLLLEHGAKVNDKEGGMTPLMYAIAAGTPVLNSEHLLTVQILLDKGADVTLKDSHGWTALTFAAVTGDAAVARLLLARGAAVDGQGDDGSTPLMWAVRQSAGDPDVYADIINELLAKGASIQIKDKSGYTALMYAQRGRNPGMVRVLLDADAARQGGEKTQ